MNCFLDTQIKNMLSMVKTFEMGCEFAAKKNDGMIDKHEAAQLKKIKAATAKFKKELESIK